jgi:tetratricopeptide (TPR) repeat protein
MPKPGRNDPCPCGSGQKYKRCCMGKAQAAEHAQRAAMHKQQRARIEELATSIEEANELDEASNGVVDLIHAGRLDEAEQAARDLLLRYPEVPDGHDRLGMVHEARGNRREAADCYRKVVEFMRAHAADFDPALQIHFLERIAKLDPPAAAD